MFRWDQTSSNEVTTHLNTRLSNVSPFFTICAGFHRAFPNLESAFQYHGMGFTTSGVGIREIENIEMRTLGF